MIFHRPLFYVKDISFYCFPSIGGEFEGEKAVVEPMDLRVFNLFCAFRLFREHELGVAIRNFCCSPLPISITLV